MCDPPFYIYNIPLYAPARRFIIRNVRCSSSALEIETHRVTTLLFGKFYSISCVSSRPPIHNLCICVYLYCYTPPYICAQCNVRLSLCLASVGLECVSYMPAKPLGTLTSGRCAHKMVIRLGDFDDYCARSYRAHYIF